MDTQKNKLIQDFTTGSVSRQLVLFSIPLFLSNLLQAVYNMVDMAIVGQVEGGAGLSAVSVGGDVVNLLTFLVMGMSSAGQVIISQYIGSNRQDRLDKLIGTLSTFLLLCTVVLSGMCLLLREQILGWMNTPEDAWAGALAYSVTCAVGLIFISGYNVVSAILRGMGDSKHPFLFIGIAAVLNVILDLAFVASPLKLGAFGAALATVIAQGFSFLCGLIFLFRCRLGLAFQRSSFRINPAELSALVKLGIPMAIRYAAIQMSKLFVNSWTNSFGTTISAVTGVGNKLGTISILFATSISTAGSSMVGQNMGAEKYNRVSRVVGAAFVINLVCSGVLIAFIFGAPNFVFGLFAGDDQAVLNGCMEYIPVAALLFLSSSMRSPFNAFVSGTGSYWLNFVIAILDGIVARIGLSLLLGLTLNMGYLGLWYGNALAGFAPFLVGGAYFLSGAWRRKLKITE